MARNLCAGAVLLAAASTVHANQIRGVNVGGWLVLESWIRPSLYSDNKVPAGQGEWQFCSITGQNCAQVLQAHHQYWFNESDVATFASAGFTHLRIPVGYWILGAPFIAPGEPYVAVGWPSLVSALGWAAKYGMKVIVDLHGAPGSQNGHDNSGRSGPIGWFTEANMNKTIDVLVELATRLKAINAQPATLGVVEHLELLNEPWTVAVGGPIDFDTLFAWYVNATLAVRAAGWTGGVMVHDGFDPYNGVWKGLNALQPNITLDTHQYFCFGGWKSGWPLIGQICGHLAPMLANLTDRPPIIVGEMSGGISSGPPSPLTPDGTLFLRSYIEAQLDAFGGMTGAGQAQPIGAVAWCHRLEDPTSTWSVIDALAGGWWPNYTALAGNGGQNAVGRLTCDGFQNNTSASLAAAAGRWTPAAPEL